MKIKIVQHVPTKPSPEIGKVYEVTKTNEPNERNGGTVYFVMCEGSRGGRTCRRNGDCRGRGCRRMTLEQFIEPIHNINRSVGIAAKTL